MPAPPMILEMPIVWPALALLPMLPPPVKVTSPPLIENDFELALKVQESGVIGPKVTLTVLDPVAPKTAAWPPEMGAPVGVQLLSSL